jgi:hypothetical protein
MQPGGVDSEATRDVLSIGGRSHPWQLGGDDGHHCDGGDAWRGTVHGGGGPRPLVLGRGAFDIDPLPSAFFGSSEGTFDLGANDMNIGLLIQIPSCDNLYGDCKFIFVLIELFLTELLIYFISKICRLFMLQFLFD